MFIWKSKCATNYVEGLNVLQGLANRWGKCTVFNNTWGQLTNYLKLLKVKVFVS